MSDEREKIGLQTSNTGMPVQLTLTGRTFLRSLSSRTIESHQVSFVLPSEIITESDRESELKRNAFQNNLFPITFRSRLAHNADA